MAAATQREAELEDMLRSLYEISIREGQDTDWERVSASIKRLGIRPITARHYFHDDITPEARAAHLSKLDGLINSGEV